MTIQSIRWDGKPISAPGIYSGVPIEIYHRADICDGPSVSSSTLRDLWSVSPAYCWSRSPLNPKRVPEKESESKILGGATHALICGEPFADRYVVKPATFLGEKWNGNRIDCKRQIAQWKREGKEMLTEGDVEKIQGMAAALSLNPLVLAGILNGLIERSIFWKDSETGLWLKTRPDAIPSDSGDFSDLKTTQSVLYHDLQKTIGTYGYHQQGGLILEGAKAIGLEATSFTLVWVESAPPHCVRVQQLRDEDLARGTRQNRVALRTFANCLANNAWPGPGDDHADAEFVDLPDWRRTQIDERLRLEMREAA